MIQVNNYYPFGMVSYAWLREGEIDNANLFQGKELIAQTGWHDFGSRMYWADLGRWFSADPQKQFSSPYLAMGNMPMMGRDPNGEWFLIDDLIVGAIGFLTGYLSHGITTGDWGADALASGGIAALGGWLAYNTAGAATTAFFKSGLGEGVSSLFGSAIGQSAGSFVSSIAGQAYFNNGDIDFGLAGQSALYGLGGGATAGVLDSSPLMKLKFAGHHFVKNAMRSTAYEMGGNLVTGQEISSNLSYGLGPSGALAGLSDIATLTSGIWGQALAERKADKFVKDQKDKNNVDIKYDLKVKKVDFGIDRISGTSYQGISIEGSGEVEIPFHRLGKDRVLKPSIYLDGGKTIPISVIADFLPPGRIQGLAADFTYRFHRYSVMTQMFRKWW